VQPDAIARSLIDVWTRMASWMPGGRVDDVPHGVLITTDAPDDSLRGPLVPLPGADAVTIEAARQIVRRDGRPLAVDLIEGVADLESLLRADGFEVVVSRQVFVRRGAVTFPSVKFRRATEDDLSDLVRFEVVAFGSTVPAAEALCAPGCTTGSSITTLIEVDGEPVSKAVAHPFDNAIGIFGVATMPTRRGAGYARAAIASAIYACSSTGDKRPVWLYASDDLEPFYRSMGFEPVGRSNVWVEGYV
jgi:GNAT superfamily N-acetyltransferase